MLNRLKIAPEMAEFLGTATLTLVAIILTETTGVSYFIGTSLALTLTTIYLMFNGVSGGHFNPAITFGMWIARRISTLRAAGYVAAQMLGGLAAWQLYEYLTGQALAAKPVEFSGPLWAAEAVGAFVLALGFTAAASTRLLNGLQAALAYGASIFAGTIIAGVASAGILNPAMALGLRSWGTAYILGPLVGALVGVNLYWLLFSPEASNLTLSRAKATPLRSRFARTSKTASTSKTTKTTKVAKKPAASRGRKTTTTRSRSTRK